MVFVTDKPKAKNLNCQLFQVQSLLFCGALFKYCKNGGAVIDKCQMRTGQNPKIGRWQVPQLLPTFKKSVPPPTHHTPSTLPYTPLPPSHTPTPPTHPLHPPHTSYTPNTPPTPLNTPKHSTNGTLSVFLPGPTK